MMSGFAPSEAVRTIRGRLDVPVIDGDGHQIEFMPLVIDIVRDIAGNDVAEQLAGLQERRHMAGGSTLPGFPPSRGFFGFPAENTLDRMTASLPELHYRRLDGMGIDFAIVYPTLGLNLVNQPDDELRQAMARGLNTYYAEVFDEYRDRLEPVAAIPTNTPEEAVAELRYAVGTLGLKTVVMSGVVPRREEHQGMEMSLKDTLGHNSTYDYDPVWANCEELGVVPAFHGLGWGWNTRCSSSNYVYNHLGSFGVAQEATCRSLIMGGVPRRFPNLRFAFLEGGVAWAAQLYADMVGHFVKRNRHVVRNYDPARLDLSLCHELVTEFSHGRLADRAERFEDELGRAASVVVDDDAIDDFAESAIESPADITDIFRRQFSFGCEADDPLNALAFCSRLLPADIRLNALFASDVGHWDVPDMRQVLCEAWELVEDGHLSEEEFGEFISGNTARMLTAVNPRFFDGTVLEGAYGQAPSDA